MALPKITKVTPSYNQGRYLGATLRSVLDQRYDKLEYIVMDGGSSDGSVDLLRATGGLAYWCSEKDAGQYDAINRGFARSSGEVMAWLNADDMYLPWTLHLVGAVFERYPEVQWISGGVCFVNPDGAAFAADRLEGGLSRSLARRGGYRAGIANYLPQEGMFWRRGLWERAGGGLRTEYALAADFELWTRFAAHADPVALKSVLAAFRRHPKTQRSGANRAEYEREVASVCNALPGWRMARRLWSVAGQSVAASLVLRLLFLWGASTTLEYSIEEEAWVLRHCKAGPLYRPFVTRRAV